MAVVRRNRLTTRKILVASLGVAASTYVAALGCNRYPVGNLMPPRTPESSLDGAASDPVVTPDASDAAATTRPFDAELDDPRVTSGNLMARPPDVEPKTPVVRKPKKDAGR